MQNGTKECCCAAADAGDFRTAGRTDQTCQITAASVCRIGRGKSRCEPSVALALGERLAAGQRRVAFHARQHLGRGVLGLGPGFARPEQHPSDAGGFEIVVHPCVGRDEELRARVAY